MFFKYPLTAALVAGLCSCASVSTNRRPQPISSNTASQWIKSGTKPVILDVRTTGEFEDGHIAGAKSIPWTDRDFESRATKELDRSQPVLVYCRSGKRSAAAADKLVSMGFPDVRNLKGGTLSWQKENLPLTR